MARLRRDTMPGRGTAPVLANVLITHTKKGRGEPRPGEV